MSLPLRPIVWWVWLHRKDLCHVVVLLLGTLAAMAAQAEPLRYNLVHLEVEAAGEAAADRMQATVALSLDGAHLSRLSVQVNQRLQKALDLLGRQQAVQYGSTAYQTEAVYDYPKEGRPEQKGWRIIATLELSSQDTGAMGELLSQLQASGFAVQGLGFVLSQAKRDQLENQLTAQGLERFRHRCQLVSQALDGKGYRIVQLHITASAPPIEPVPRFNRRAMAAAAAPPLPVAPSQQAMVVQVSGQIEIQQQ